MLHGAQDIALHPGEHVRNNVTTYMDDHATEHPERVALSWVEPNDREAWDGTLDSPLPAASITYGDFNALIRRTAKGLSDLGIERGDRVIIFLPMHLTMYTAMFAAQSLGAAAVFLDSWARARHLGASAAAVEPKAMISHAAAFQLIDGIPEFEAMPIRVIAGPTKGGARSARLEEVMQAEGGLPAVPVEADETALITFTTGSSGTPKGANRRHAFLAAQHRALTGVVPYVETDTDLPAFPVFSLNNLAAGLTTVLPAVNLAQPSDRDPPALANQIRHGALTCTTLSPSMLRHVSAFCLANDVALPSLRRIVTGGAPISRDDVRAAAQAAPNAEILILYGSTEVEPMAEIEGRVWLEMATDPDPEVVEFGVNVGRVVDQLDYRFLRIVDGPIRLEETPWSELDVEPGAVGELVVAGDHVCRDYYNNEEAFRSNKIRDPGGRVWHRTGDLAYEDDDGYLWIVGRVHNAIDRAGEYYFPVHAEVLVSKCPGVRQGAFLAIPDTELGERTAVVVALHDDADAGAVQSEIERLFAKNQIPIDSFYLVDAIPMDPRHHSKVEYGALRAKLEEDSVPDSKAR